MHCYVAMVMGVTDLILYSMIQMYRVFKSSSIVQKLFALR